MKTSNITQRRLYPFYKLVVEAYPEGKTVMLLENAHIHHAKLLQPFLEDYKARFELVFLTSYSPQLNLV
ncbi:transposase [Paenibacillus sp. FSL H8-0122]|uniref:transposase n=1 Tax=Paenibacillus sp. FSL H8-0122 TaxID=2954510 RepID=UPI00404700B3